MKALRFMEKRNIAYLLWDVLTTASFGKEDLIKRSVVSSDVIVTWPYRQS